MVYGRNERTTKCTFKMNNRKVRTIVSLELKILKRKKKDQAMNWKNTTINKLALCITTNVENTLNTSQQLMISKAKATFDRMPLR